MSRFYCAAEGCFNDVKKRGSYGSMSNINFFPFPTKKKNPKARKIWLNLLRRQDYDPPRHHRVCSRHFVDGEPSKNHPFPTLFSYNNYKEPKKPRVATSINKRERRTSDPVPNVKFQQKDILPGVIEGDINPEICMTVVREEEVVTSECPGNVSSSIWPMDHDYMERHQPESRDASTQTDLGMDNISKLVENGEKLEDPDKLLRDIFIQKVTSTDESVKKYTGIPSKQFLEGFFGILDKASPTLKYWSGQHSVDETAYQKNTGNKKTGPQRKLTRYEEFILTLVKLRLALFTFFLADLFGTSSARVSQIFTTWVNFMYCVVAPLLKWPLSKYVKKFMPGSFKSTFPNTTCIIDCTELFISRSKNPTAQSQTYSSYKHHNTYKALVAITPSGAFTFVSKLWGGNTSDRYITRESGFLDFIRPGDEVMADRGFLIRDLLLERKATLVIPPFTKACKWGKGKRLSSLDVVKTRNIARLRIHVERAIERLKNFHILSNTMPLSLKPLANQMLVVCAFLCNMLKPLVTK